ncbi:hypothetical protein [Mycolicibacterium sp. CR10]|uniref:hypothetical protein n=1 Tax=Mycolicibacterium sp. CR10 TaxID=2562314 RepID=UPI001484D813|nr:hypothetical protein [Mycolicibacterium sp. CR10]
MKRAVVRQRRTLADGRKFVCIVCPVCEHRHWLPADTNTSECPRRPGTFTLTDRNQNR